MNPEDLLAQIQELLGQYLALGSDTPVAAEAQALMAAIEAGGAGGGGGVEGGPPPEEALMAAMGAEGGGAPPEGGMPPDQMPMMSGQSPVPDLAGMAPEEGSAPPLDLRAASMMAEDDMKKRMGKGYR